MIASVLGVVAKQTTRTGTEPQKWRSHGGLSTGVCVGGSYRE